MREIILADSAGFCFGVKRAVKLAEESAGRYGSVVSLGQLIHNNDVAKRLEELGVRTVEGVSEVRQGDAAVIRSHGVGKSVYDALTEKGAVIVDATCPMVKKVHELAQQESKEGRTVIVIGQREHPEVEAIIGWCDNALVFEEPEETEKYLTEHPEICEKPVTVVSQTTAEREKFEINVKIIKKRQNQIEI